MLFMESSSVTWRLLRMQDYMAEMEQKLTCLQGRLDRSAREVTERREHCYTDLTGPAVIPLTSLSHGSLQMSKFLLANALLIRGYVVMFFLPFSISF